MVLARIVVVVILAIILVAPTGNTQEDMFFWLDRGNMRKTQLEYSGMFLPEQDVEGTVDEFDLFEHEAKLAFPVWADDAETQRIGVFTNLGYQDIDTLTVFPDSGGAFPDDLYNLEFGLDYVRMLDNGWVYGGVFSVGSPSDEPFDSGDEIVYEANGFLRIPHVDNNHWLFALNFSTNREFLENIPLPGVAYWYQPSDQLTAMLGIPFVVQYKPVERVTLRASYVPVRNVFAEASYDVTEQVQLFTGFSWDNERYLLAGRANDDDRLFYYEKKLQGGVRLALHEAIDVELAGGYSFDRFYFIGEEYDDRDFDRVDIDDSPFAAFRVKARF